MDAQKSLHCELKIMNAKNVQVTNSNGYLFVRCYLSAGNNKRVRLDSREVSTNGEFSWNESFSLDCIGTKQSMDMIIHGTIDLELRWRSTRLSMFGGSHLLARTDVSWRDVFELPNMEIERWMVMKSKKKDVKVPSLCIAMKIEAPFVYVVDLAERKRKNKWDEKCGCYHGDCSNSPCVDGYLGSNLKSQDMASASGDRSSDSTSQTSQRKGRNGPFRRCYCGLENRFVISASDKNPLRRYFCCKYFPDEKEDCGYFECYYETLPSSWYKEKVNEIKFKTKHLPVNPICVREAPTDNPNSKLLFLMRVMMSLLLVLEGF